MKDVAIEGYRVMKIYIKRKNYIYKKQNCKKHKKARRYSGGISIFAKNSITNGVKPIKNSHSDVLWIKLDHVFFNIDRDVYLAVVDISPEYSSGNTNDIGSKWVDHLNHQWFVHLKF
jgi:hypothetical protein